MRVEIDLYNAGEDEYQKFLGKYLDCALSVTAATTTFQALTLAAAGRDVWGPRLKSVGDPFPYPPRTQGAASGEHRLLPGMSGQMRVMLRKFGESYLLLSSAVFTRSGTPYVMEVRNGVTHLLPVRVQVNDGRLAKVAVVARSANNRTGQAEVLRELTGDETIVLSRQSELSEGQSVRPVPEPW
jgi:hypothetical protein